MARPSVVSEQLPLPARLRRARLRQSPRIDRNKVGLAAMLFAFFGIFVLALTAAGAVAGAMVMRLATGGADPIAAVALVIAGASGVSMVWLARGFTRQLDVDYDESIELTRQSEPRLFAFLDDLCERTGAPFPDHVYARPDVNAGVFVKYSVFNPFRPSEQHLLLGMGLINALNRTELEAVVAHEMGHFSQRSLWMHHHARLAAGLLAEISRCCDAAEQLACRWRASRVPSRVGARVMVALAVVTRRSAERVHQKLEDLEAAVSRRLELQADRIAVNTTGSEAIVRAVERVQLADRCYGQTLYDLEHAAGRGLRTEDLFYHQQQLVERMHQRGETGDDPTEPGDTSHPSPAIRQDQARAACRPTRLDDRSAWTLFDDPAALRRRLTDRLYHTRFDATLEPNSIDDVQAFLDGEHAELLLSEDDRRLYGHRFIEIGELSSAIAEAETLDWSDDELADRLATLTGDQFTEAIRRVERNVNGASSSAEEDFRWLADRDRRLLIAMLRAAEGCSDDSADELVRRYQFHLHLQDSIRWLRTNTPAIANIAAAGEAGQLDVDEQLLETIRVLYDGLRRALHQSPPPPRLHGLSPHQPLSMVVLDSPLPDEQPLQTGQLDDEWLRTFIGRWQQACEALQHLRWKSLGALLLYQRQLQSRIE